MKLNPDCIRDILFSIEELSKPFGIISSQSLAETEYLKDKYSIDEIVYHLKQLNWSSFIVVPDRCTTLDGTFFVKDLSPLGHEFIANIRQDNNWNKVKEISKEVGSSTLSSIKTIAENVIASAINVSMGLH